MEVVIRLSKQEEAKALPILLRHSAGVVLPDRTYVLDRAAAQALHDAGVVFRELNRTGVVAASEGAAAGERI